MWDQLQTNKAVGGLFPNDAGGNAWGDPENGVGPGLRNGVTPSRSPAAFRTCRMISRPRSARSIGETGPIFAALGMAEGVSPEQMQKNLEARIEGTPVAEAQREAIRRAIAFKKY